MPTDFSKPIQVDLPISHAGAFCYWVEYDGDAPGTRVKGREGYFNIDPILRTKARASVLTPSSKISDTGGKILNDYVNLPIDGLSILTLVSKWMGPVDNWRKYLSESSARGYNMIHWTPLQERGESDSPYSIRNQLVYDPSMFTSKSDYEKDGGRAKVEELLRLAREEYGLLALTDVVLNHTANDSPWLPDHPEAGKHQAIARIEHTTERPSGYSPANTPHLTPALELDDAMIEFSTSLEANGLPTTVTSAQDVDVLMNAFEAHLQKLDFWQYYVLDAKAERESVTAALKANKGTTWAGIEHKTVVELSEIVRTSGKVVGLGVPQKRFGTHVKGEDAAGLVKAAFVDVKDVDALADAWVKVVDVLNVPLYEEWKNDTQAALDNIRNRLRYIRLEEHGPKLGPITKAYVDLASVRGCNVLT